MRILFKYATRSRPELFKRGIESILNNVSNDNFQILVSVDHDDNSMIPMTNEYKDHPNISVVVGRSRNKIHAINRDMELAEGWDILVNMSDDMVFVEKGFDDIIRNEFFFNNTPSSLEHEYVLGLDECLHFPDGNRTDLITMSIMGKDYYKRFGYIYNPEYVSLYCDNEQTEVAKILGCYKYVDKIIFNHLHPAYGKAIFDLQYQHTESFGGIDRETYLKRKALNYGL